MKLSHSAYNCKSYRLTLAGDCVGGGYGGVGDSDGGVEAVEEEKTLDPPIRRSS